MPPSYRVCEILTEAVLYFQVVFSPWAFGTTQVWAIRVMNTAGLVLGALLLSKWGIRRATGYRVKRWNDISTSAPRADSLWKRIGRRLPVALAILTVVMLAYCLISAINARATYFHDPLHPDVTSKPVFHDRSVAWLPHSYDSTATWFAFWQYLALALSFWSTRDWLLAKSRRERHLRDLVPENEPAIGEKSRLPDRLTRLLWVLCLNGALLGLEAILQRVSNTPRLLWLVQPRINYATEAQFGPYAYRSNAAQYFNLVWPMCLGFWWTLRERARHSHRPNVRSGGSVHTILVPCLVIMAACPIISTSRGGALVAAVGLIAAMVVLLLAKRRSSWWVRLELTALFTVIIGVAGYLGWQALGPRLKLIFSDKMSNRLDIYENARPMLNDFPTYGSGPGTFPTLYQLYRKNLSENWAAFAHDDWLEIRITFGSVGLAIILAMLAVVALQWWTGVGIPSSGPLITLIWVSLTGCLAHAKYDFPFQVYSILFLFLLLSCCASCLAKET